MQGNPIPPVIMIGMHRSGTTVLCQILEHLGLYVGAKKNSNFEAEYFFRLNNWLLTQSGGDWDYPETIQTLLDNTRIRSLVLDYIKYEMRSPHAIKFLGLRKFLRFRNIAKLNFPWGWKDPRNTYTLPIWLDLFPDAKVIHIYRHGVDVANSLRVREEDVSLNNLETRHKRFKRFHLYWLKALHIGFVDSLRCYSLEGSFSLWETYVERAQDYISQLGDQKSLEIKYEDILTEPHYHIRILASFCGLDIHDTLIQTIATMLHSDRAYAYLRNSEMQTFSEKVSDRLKMKGYLA